jgi:ankyrin repeat protein
MSYIKDSLGNTPLMYALKRKSYNCVSSLLDYAIKSNQLYQNIEMNEITALIEFSPTNLGKFFDSSIDDIEEDVPLFGLLKNGESTLYLLGNKNILDQD